MALHICLFSYLPWAVALAPLAAVPAASSLFTGPYDKDTNFYSAKIHVQLTSGWSSFLFETGLVETAGEITASAKKFWTSFSETMRNILHECYSTLNLRLRRTKLIRFSNNIEHFPLAPFIRYQADSLGK